MNTEDNYTKKVPSVNDYAVEVRYDMNRYQVLVCKYITDGAPALVRVYMEVPNGAWGWKQILKEEAATYRDAVKRADEIVSSISTGRGVPT